MLFRSKTAELVAVARLRLAGVLMHAKQYDDALKALDADMPPEFTSALADRKGDILFAQGKKDDAAKAYQQAWTLMADDLEYRRFIEGKLTALGQAPKVDDKAPAQP